MIMELSQVDLHERRKKLTPPKPMSRSERERSLGERECGQERRRKRSHQKEKKIGMSREQYKEEKNFVV